MKGKKLEFALQNLLSIVFTLGVTFPLLTSTAPTSTPWKSTGTYPSNFSTETSRTSISKITKTTPSQDYEYELIDYIIDDDTTDNQNGAEVKNLNNLREPLTVVDPDKLLYLIISLFAVVSFAIVILVLSFRYLPRQDGDPQNGSSPLGNDSSVDESNSKAPFSRTPILPPGPGPRSTIGALNTGGKDRELKEMVDSTTKLIGGSNGTDFCS